KLFTFYPLMVLSVAAMVACAAPQTRAQAKIADTYSSKAMEPSEGCLAFVGSNDIHGAVVPHERVVAGERVRYGGLVGMSAYIEILRKHYGERLILADAGDMYQGTLASNLSEGEAVMKALSLMGYDVGTVGNHEFDFGARGEGDDVLGALKYNIATSTFPFVVGNIRDKKTGAPVAWENASPSFIEEKAGIKVGYLGVITPETPRVTKPYYITELIFDEPADFVIKEAAALRKKGAELVVLIAHLGGYCRELTNPKDISGCDSDDELFALLQHIPEGTVDVVLGGHTHGQVAHWVNGMLALEAGSRGRQLSWADVCVKEGGGIDKVRTRIHKPINLCLDVWEDGSCTKRKTPTKTHPAEFLGQKVVPASAVEEAMVPYLEVVKKVQARMIDVKLPHPVVRRGKDNLGLMIAEAIRISAGVEFGVQNLGGVRANLAEGELNYGDVFQVLPFGNQIAILKLSGKEMEGVIQQLIMRRKGDPPYMAGIKVTGDAKSGFTVLQQNGQPFDPEKTYQLSTSDFLAYGGEGLNEIFGELGEDKCTFLDVTLREALIKELQRKYPVSTSASVPVVN
ncbi:5'-nucleotidase C-terminal domain-containing protein, partial [Myxococcota bacterium]|nr:5'-nucleotidase C-terminal domain-containing protein [Myxococcota bacterium]